MQKDSLILYAKTESLFFQVYPSFKNYPKAEKYGLCLQIKNGFIDLLEAISVAKEVPSRRRVATQEAAARLTKLTSMFRLARKEKYISAGFFEQVDIKLTEIKKLLVGFMRATGKPRQDP